MPPLTARTNAARSIVRACIVHVFARQKDQMGLFIRTIALLLEQNDEWAVQRGRYITLESVAQLSDDPTVTLPDIAA